MKYLKLLFELLTMPFVLVVGAFIYPLLYCAEKWNLFLDMCFAEPVKVVPAQVKKKTKVKKVK
ncbi:hypothetical protein EB118_06835 [bacterium]|nr:hypothetical protein [bacterium]